MNHSAEEEYARGEAHTTTTDGYRGPFKRGMRGVHRHRAEEYLHRYLAEFDLRYDARVRLGVDDATRADLALGGRQGKAADSRVA